VDQEAVNIQKQLQAELAEHYKTGKPFPVKIIEDKG
jgi:hypothetical protein